MESLGSLGLACGLVGTVLGSVSLAHSRLTDDKLSTLVTKQDDFASALSEMRALQPSVSGARQPPMSQIGSKTNSSLELGSGATLADMKPPKTQIATKTTDFMATIGKVLKAQYAKITKGGLGAVCVLAKGERYRIDKGVWSVDLEESVDDRGWSVDLEEPTDGYASVVWILDGPTKNHDSSYAATVTFNAVAPFWVTSDSGGLLEVVVSEIAQNTFHLRLVDILATIIELPVVNVTISSSSSFAFSLVPTDVVTELRTFQDSPLFDTTQASTDKWVRLSDANTCEIVLESSNLLSLTVKPNRQAGALVSDLLEMCSYARYQDGHVGMTLKFPTGISQFSLSCAAKICLVSVRALAPDYWFIAVAGLDKGSFDPGVTIRLSDDRSFEVNDQLLSSLDITSGTDRDRQSAELALSQLTLMAGSFFDPTIGGASSPEYLKFVLVTTQKITVAARSYLTRIYSYLNAPNPPPNSVPFIQTVNETALTVEAIIAQLSGTVEPSTTKKLLGALSLNSESVMAEYKKVKVDTWFGGLYLAVSDACQGIYMLTKKLLVLVETEK